MVHVSCKTDFLVQIRALRVSRGAQQFGRLDPSSAAQKCLRDNGAGEGLQQFE